MATLELSNDPFEGFLLRVIDFPEMVKLLVRKITIVIKVIKLGFDINVTGLWLDQGQAVQIVTVFRIKSFVI